MARQTSVMDGNEAAASVAYRLNEVIAIYPITPSSPMGEWADQWKNEGRQNIWGLVPDVVEMQSEGGAAGALHGALQAGALATTFTASQGLLLMIPNMYKIAGELTPAVIHVAARTLATHALSIFGDHSDVMATRATGFALLSSNSVQEAMDMALIAHAASLESRIPFVHFFDGFRTSHEVATIEPLSDDDLHFMIRDELVHEHRDRALTPDQPVLRGSAQNPDVFFQAREAGNPFYDACPAIVQDVMNRFAERTGRAYHLFDYVGAPDAERVVVLMGSAAGAVEETIEALQAKGEKVGLLKVRLFQPFSSDALLAALPSTVRAIALLDRTKEPGAPGEPLYMDALAAFGEARAAAEAGRVASRFAKWPRVVGGRYGLSSKEFTPAMAKAIFDELQRTDPRNHFTIGIQDDVTFTSLKFDPEFTTESPRTTRAIFYGLGSDGTVGANKNSIKIIGEETESFAQGYFVYDSKKAGTVTVSHLRFGPEPIRSSYLIRKANFIGCHQFQFLERMDILEAAERGRRVFLEFSVRPRGSLGALAAAHAGTDYFQTAEVLCGGRLQRCAGSRHGLSRQHDHADVLFRDQRRDAARGSHHLHQVGDPENLRQAGRCRGAEKLRGRGRDIGAPVRGCHSIAGVEHVQHPAAGAGGSAEIRARCAGPHHRGPRRHPAGQRVPGRRNLSARHSEMGKAQYRSRNSRVG